MIKLPVVALISVITCSLACADPFDLTRGNAPNFPNPRNQPATDITIRLANPFAPGAVGIDDGASDGGSGFPDPGGALSPFIPGGGFGGINFQQGTMGTGVPAGGSYRVQFIGFPAAMMFTVHFSYADGQEVQAIPQFQGLNPLPSPPPPPPTGFVPFGTITAVPETATAVLSALGLIVILGASLRTQARRAVCTAADWFCLRFARASGSRS